jgi:hypothetical protein
VVDSEEISGGVVAGRGGIATRGLKVDVWEVWDDDGLWEELLLLLLLLLGGWHTRQRSNLRSDLRSSGGDDREIERCE